MPSLINFIKGLVTIARFLPELFSAITKLAKMIKDAIDDVERKKVNDKFNEALKEAKKTKDTSDLEDMFGREPKQEAKLLKIQSFDIKFKEPAKAQKLSIDLSDAKMGFSVMSASSSVIINPTVDPNTPRNTTTLGGGMGGSMGSKFISIAVLFLLLGCKSSEGLPGENAPNYKPEIFMGDSENGGITRKQSNEFVDAKDPKFDDYVAVHANTMSCIFQTYVNNCERFKKQEVKCKPVEMSEIKEMLNEF